MPVSAVRLSNKAVGVRRALGQTLCWGFGAAIVFQTGPGQIAGWRSAIFICPVCKGAPSSHRLSQLTHTFMADQAAQGGPRCRCLAAGRSIIAGHHIADEMRHSGLADSSLDWTCTLWMQPIPCAWTPRADQQESHAATEDALQVAPAPQNIDRGSMTA